jgi:hypothetical protein
MPIFKKLFASKKTQQMKAKKNIKKPRAETRLNNQKLRAFEKRYKELSTDSTHQYTKGYKSSLSEAKRAKYKLLFNESIKSSLKKFDPKEIKYLGKIKVGIILRDAAKYASNRL